MTIVVLAVGSISIMGTTHMTRADQIGKACVFFACGNATINGETSGGGGGGQPTPTTGTLIVKKVVVCSTEPCASPSDFKFTVFGNNPSPDHFDGSTTGTEVTLGPGNYQVSEQFPSADYLGKGSPDCNSVMKVGETKTCTITNTKQAG